MKFTKLFLFTLLAILSLGFIANVTQAVTVSNSVTVTVTTPTIINGSCSAPLSHYTCSAGTSSSNLDLSTSWWWACTSSTGGTTASCTENKPVIPAVCSPTHYNCSTGTSSYPLSLSTHWWWACTAGTTVYCTEDKPVAVVNGSCGITHYSCSTGTSASNVSGTTAWTWGCNGSNGGTSTTATACTENKTAVVNGSCGTNPTHYNCNAGTPANKKNGTAAWIWSCMGSNGGSFATCTESKSALVNGACSSPASHYSCSTGTSASNVSGTTAWTWGCNGSNGGTSTTATACKENKTCTNGANNPPTCTTFSSCSNGANNPPTCTTFSACSNGAYNPPTCTDFTCPVSTDSNYLGNKCSYVCANGGTDWNTCTPPVVDCQGSWNPYCLNGLQTYNISTPASNGGQACDYEGGTTRSCVDTCSNPDSHYTCNPSTIISTNIISNNLAYWYWRCPNSIPAQGITYSYCSEKKPLPNLTVSAASPTRASAVIAQNFTATITNSGGASMGKTSNYFWQIAPLANGGGIIKNEPASSLVNLPAYGTATAFLSTNFPTVGTYSIRACADKTSPGGGGVIYESNENDNCGPVDGTHIQGWTNIVVDNNYVPTVTLQSATKITSKSATFRATITNSGTPANSITGHGICYSNVAINRGPISLTNSNYTCVPDNNNISVNVPFDLDISSFSPSTTYYYSGYATNPTGTGFSSIKSFTTSIAPDPLPLSTINSFTIKNSSGVDIISSIKYNTFVYIAWTSDATSCDCTSVDNKGTQGPTCGSGTSSPSLNKTSPLKKTMTFTLSCRNGEGAPTPPQSKTVIVDDINTIYKEN